MAFLPVEVRDAFRKPVLQGVASPEAIYQDYLSLVEPYAGGNRHPGFMGWVQGAGAPIGALAEMLAAGLNMNCGGRDHVGVALEGQIALWVRQWFGFPDTSAGLFTTGASAANMSAVLAARTTALGEAARRRGQGGPAG